MPDALRKIDSYTAGMDHSAFLQDEKTVDAVVRNLEVLGEAARQIPDAFAARHPEVPWRKITGLQIVQNDLPALRAMLEKLG